MKSDEFEKVKKAIELAISHILKKGCDDIFRPPIFSNSLEHQIISQDLESFKKLAYSETLKFIQKSNLTHSRIGEIRKTLVVKDHHAFRQVAWMDPFDSIKYLSVCILLYEKIEQARIPKELKFVHSHRGSSEEGELFDRSFGYDSFRERSGELTREYKGKWKVVTDISNFFDRIGNHSLENHLLDLECDIKHVTLLREILLFWAGDRRSFGVPVGSDASRIISEAVLIDIDKKLHDSGIVFLRYVDDYRIFTHTRAEAYSALQLLTTLLADEGLSVNGKKTDIIKIERDIEAEDNTQPLQSTEHQALDLSERIEVKIKRRVSGRSTFSKHYREPGKEALEKIKELPKEKIIQELENAEQSKLEDQVKLTVKYFIYVKQDLDLLEILLGKKITTIFYICDALIKEQNRIPEDIRKQILEFLLNSIELPKFAYPYQIPLLRLCSTPAFNNTTLIRHIFDNHKYSDNGLFFREALALCSAGLDRSRMRSLSLDYFPTLPRFVQRAIYFATLKHPNMSADEKRPLLKNMKQIAQDWFVDRMIEKASEAEAVATA